MVTWSGAPRAASGVIEALKSSGAVHREFSQLIPPRGESGQRNHLWLCDCGKVLLKI